MRHPFQVIPIVNSSLLLAVLTALTLILMGVLGKISKPLGIPDVAPNGIISLEFAGDSVRAKAIVAAWRNKDVLQNAKKVQWLDFLYIAAYSTTLSLACIWSIKLLPGFDSAWLNTGIVLAWGQWFAALLDVIENLALFPFLYRDVDDKAVWAKVAAFCAVLKFSLIITGLLYVVISLVIFGASTIW